MILAAIVAFQLELARESLTGTHCRYREYVDGVASETYVTEPCNAIVQPMVIAPPDAAREMRVVNGRLLRRTIRDAGTLHPVAEDADARTGEIVRRVPLFFRGKSALVFDPNPVVTLDDPTLQDRNDSVAAVPEAAYREVELERVEASGPLRGTHVRLVDRQIPAVAPPDASQSLGFDREHDGFEDVNAYFHIDRNQEYLQSLGYRGRRAVVPYAIDVDAHAGAGADNSVFLPSASTIGRGTLFFGEGGTDDAEDADLVVHEYGHAILEWIAPGTFTGTYASQARALGEGFGDYWAFSAHREMRLASGRDPYCFADWDARCWEDDASQQCAYPAGSDCLRRLDATRTMGEYENVESPGVEHRNGTIWSSALREIHEHLGREATDTIVIESMFGLPPHPTFAVAALRMIEADRLLYNGRHADVICAAMFSRGILETCGAMPRGEQTFFQSSERGVPIPEASAEGVVSTIVIDDLRAIEQLAVRVDIAHPTRGDLRIQLVGPDGTTVLLQEISLDVTRDIHATYGVTANPAESLDVFRGRSAAGEWKLVIVDRRLLDAGTLRSWGLSIRFEGDEPVEARPRGARAQMIPVVAHVYGSGARPYRSDVRLANVGDHDETATLIFTRSEENGWTDFGALDVSIGAGRTVAFDDVVGSAFHTAGSGTLEIVGNVIAFSRTYEVTSTGTLGQQVPTVTATTAVGEDALVVAAFTGPDSAHDRVNLGIAETAGGSGIVRLSSSSGTADVVIAPFSHRLLRVGPDAFTITVLSGDAHIAAYLSQLDAVTKDPMFIPAELRSSGRESRIAPYIGSPFWRSEVWFTDAPVAIEPIVPADAGIGAIRVTPGAGTFAGSRVRHDGTHQSVPLLPRSGPDEQHLLFIENGPGFRTNIGIVSDVQASAWVTVYDAAGEVVTSGYLSTGGGAAQFMVTRPIADGRAVVRFLHGEGRAYASLIDTGSGDATYVHGQ